MRNPLTWVERRSAHTGALSHEKISKQRKLALWMTIFSAVRTVIWLIAMLLIAAHWLGIHNGLIHWTVSLSSTVIFVTFISFYCNASTDAANLSASIAALFSADSHRSIESSRKAMTQDFSELEADVARLADLQPGKEAADLAESIRTRLASSGG